MNITVVARITETKKDTTSKTIATTTTTTEFKKNALIVAKYQNENPQQVCKMCYSMW